MPSPGYAATKRLQIVRGATHLFEELGPLEQVANLACDWFESFSSARLTYVPQKWRPPPPQAGAEDSSRYGMRIEAAAGKAGRIVEARVVEYLVDSKAEPGEVA